jgi:hypothetical protein
VLQLVEHSNAAEGPTDGVSGKPRDDKSPDRRIHERQNSRQHGVDGVHEPAVAWQLPGVGEKPQCGALRTVGRDVPCTSRRDYATWAVNLGGSLPSRHLMEAARGPNHPTVAYLYCF